MPARLIPKRYLERSLALGPRRGPDPPLPPNRLRFMGESDESFLEIGDQLVDLLTEHAGLCSDSRVLDIGCAYGRLPHALRRRGFASSYLGIDVLKPHVRWCRRRLGGDGFQFRHVDIANERYNPDGEMAVRDLDLGDARFDVIAAFSVFTHMWPDDVEAYLRLISRSLAMDGRAAATFFLLDREWHELADADRVARKMPFEYEAGCRYESEDDPLHRVGYEANWLLQTGGEAGLLPACPPVYGTWSWRPVDKRRRHGYQDLFVFERLEDGLRRR